MKKLLVIMPMAGEGKRFAQTGEQILKPFIKVDNEFMFVRAMNSMREMFNYYELYFELVVLDNVAKQYDLDNIVSGMKNTYVCKLYEKTKGPAETVWHGIHDILHECEEITLSYYNIQTIVLDCDLEVNCKEFKHFVDMNNMFIKKPFDCILLTHHETNPRYSYVKLYENLRVINIAEKNPISEHAIIGTYCFSSVYDLLKNVNELLNDMRSCENIKEPYMSDVVRCMLNNEDNVISAKLHEGDMYNSFGTPEELEEYKNKEENESDNK